MCIQNGLCIYSAKRIAEMKAKAKKEKFGRVFEITEPEYKKYVRNRFLQVFVRSFVRSNAKPSARCMCISYRI